MQMHRAHWPSPSAGEPTGRSTAPSIHVWPPSSEDQTRLPTANTRRPAVPVGAPATYQGDWPALVWGIWFTHVRPPSLLTAMPNWLPANIRFGSSGATASDPTFPTL